MKKSNSILLITGLLLVLISCNTQGEFSDPEMVAEDLLEMRSLLIGIETTLALAVEPEDSVDFGARTISPTADNPDIITHLQDGSGNYLTPFEVYTAFGGDGTNEVRVPDVGYFDDYYSAGDQAYFQISPISGTRYRIKLYLYPRADFTVKYNYEEYIVDNAATSPSWEWENQDAEGNIGALISYITYLSDGTTAVRNIEWSNSGTNSYRAFTVGTDILNDSAFEYPGSISQPSRDSDDTTTWSSHTTSTITETGASVTEFYSEQGDAFSGVTYISEEVNSNSTETVTRFEGDYSTGSETIRSKSTLGNAISLWQTETVETVKSVVGGVINYTDTYDLWYSDPITARSETSSYRTVLDLVETGVDTDSYTGTMSEYYGTSGTIYEARITNRNNGTYKYTQKKRGTSTSRSAAAEEFDLDLDQNNDLAFSVEIGNGTFSGNYVQGKLVGTYTVGTESITVTADKTWIFIGESPYTYEQLTD